MIMMPSAESSPEGLGEDPTLRVMELIHGADIERSLLDLASMGGTRIAATAEQPERYAVSRLALSESDLRARKDLIGPLMESAGMSLVEHPFGLIGTLVGEEPLLPPLVIFSHTDSVPKGDMYDGVTGVIGGIKVVQALTETGVKNRRNIHVVALTGEESSAFGFALFGSRGMWHGLTDRELDASIPGGKTIRETIGPVATEIVKHPIVGDGGVIPMPHAVIELHVEQNDTLDRAGIDLGVVEAVAAPERYNVEFGQVALEIDTDEPPNATYLQICVRGKSDHSGATPMGLENRADGLVATAKFLLTILAQESVSNVVDIGDIKVDEQAINKIPGATTTNIRISGDSDEDVLATLKQIQGALNERNGYLSLSRNRFGEVPITIEEINTQEAGHKFFKKAEVRPRQAKALALIANVSDVATAHTGEKVVGTVGTYDMSPDGKISLGLDVRGIDKESRDRAIAQMKPNAQIMGEDEARFGDVLPGSGDPVVLNADLVKLTKEIIDEYNIGSSAVMFSAAGHDAQNAAKAGHPTVMIFCQSNAGGIAHHPDAYTKPSNLEQGVRALAALTLRLAS